jgi:hypothetical protein
MIAHPPKISRRRLLGALLALPVLVRAKPVLAKPAAAKEFPAHLLRAIQAGITTQLLCGGPLIIEPISCVMQSAVYRDGKLVLRKELK